MNISDTGINFIKGFEGFSAIPYKDMVGVLTLGYGMTGSLIKGLTSISITQATALLKTAIQNSYAVPISNDLVSKKVTLKQNQFDALVSFAYNVGTTGLLNSTLYRNIVSGSRDRSTILTDFCMWDKAGGNVVSGLLRRRTAEAEMFLTGTETVSTVITKPAVAVPTMKQFVINMTSNIQNKGVVTTSGNNLCKSGTEGLGLRLEMFSINIPELVIEYSAHIQNVGDTTMYTMGTTVGSIGVDRRIEGITIHVVSIPTGYKLQYRTNIQNKGLTPWVESDVFSGTKDLGLRCEEIQIQIIKA